MNPLETQIIQIPVHQCRARSIDTKTNKPACFVTGSECPYQDALKCIEYRTHVGAEVIFQRSNASYYNHGGSEL